MMIDDNDVALRCAPMHLRDEAALKRTALLPETSVRARVNLVPECARLRKFRQLRAIARVRDLLPSGNRAVMLDLFQTAQHWLIGKIVELLAAQIVVAPLHVADVQLA